MLNDSTVERIIRQTLAEPVSVCIAGTAAATATNYPPSCFIAKESCRVVQISVVYGTAASGAGTLDVKKRPSGTAIGSSTSILSSTVALNGTADTPVNATLNTTNAVLKAGDILGLVAATTTGLADVNVTIWVETLIPALRN